jgi:SAM-dependent methyltransferase
VATALWCIVLASARGPDAYGIVFRVRPATAHGNHAQVESLPCALCGSASAEALFSAQDHSSRERFELTRCTQCGFVSTRPRPEGAQLSRYYPPAYYGQAGRRFRGGLEWAVHFFRQRLAEQIDGRFARPGRALEVGSGRGTLLAELARRGWQAVGTEYSAALAEASINNLGVQVYPAPDLRDCMFEAGSFDVAVCYHVLEHLPDPLETLREIRRVLQPQGVLLLAVPNFGGWLARWSGPNWFALDVPRHLGHYTPRTLQVALDTSGFIVMRRSTLSLEQDVFGFAQSALNMAGFPFNIFYDLIRSQSARLRYQAGRRGRDLTVMVLGGALVAVGLPLACVAAAAGQGGTLEVWAGCRP